jgi:hypothetical protein
VSKQSQPQEKPSKPGPATGQDPESGHTEQAEMHSKDAHEAKTTAKSAPSTGAVKK